MKKLLRDQCGAVAPFLAATIFLLIGVGTLAIELPRMATFTTDLQNAADAAALAGAAELTGLDGSINRATCAAINTFTNSQMFGSGSSSVTLGDSSCNTATNVTIDFLSAVPPSDTTAIPNSDVTTKDSNARFIRVTIANQGINFTFASIFGIYNTTAAVIAVAGNDTELCQTPPMFICNPTEPTGNTNASLPVNYDPTDPSPYTTSVGGVAIRAFYPGNNSQLSPGNFGLLCPGGAQCNPSASNIEQMFADPKGTCLRTQNVTLLSKPGMDQNAENGLNVRLDDWASGNAIQGWRSLSSFAPAYDVTQGRSVVQKDVSGNNACPNTGSGGALFSTPTTGTSGPIMPDTCLLDSSGTLCSQTTGNANIGDGNWARTTYFNVNHDINTVPTALGTSPSPYQVYRWEVQNAAASVANSVVASGDAIYGSTNTATENGQSNSTSSPKGYACYKGGTTSPDAYTYSPLNDVPGEPGGGTLSFQAFTDRRVMPIAIVDCLASGLAGGQQTVTPVEFDYSFIIGPSGDPFYSQNYTQNNKAIFFQLLGKEDETALNQSVHNVIRLYRR